MNEENKLEEMFGIKKIWAAPSGNKYKLFWCGLCDTWSISHEKCSFSSCCGGSCPECHEDHLVFLKLKTSPCQYLTPEEIKIMDKIWLLRDRHIPNSLAAGFDEINWKWLEENGQLCDLDDELFAAEIAAQS